MAVIMMVAIDPQLFRPRWPNIEINCGCRRPLPGCRNSKYVDSGTAPHRFRHHQMQIVGDHQHRAIQFLTQLVYQIVQGNLSVNVDALRGSSSTSSCGWFSRARASSTRWVSPPESFASALQSGARPGHVSAPAGYPACGCRDVSA